MFIELPKPEFRVPEYPTHHLEVCNNRIVTFFFETTSIWVKSYLRYTTYCKYVVETSTNPNKPSLCSVRKKKDIYCDFLGHWKSQWPLVPSFFLLLPFLYFAYMLMILCDLFSKWACALHIVQVCAGVLGRPRGCVWVHAGAPGCAGVCVAGVCRFSNNYEFSEHLLETNVFM